MNNKIIEINVKSYENYFKDIDYFLQMFRKYIDCLIPEEMKITGIVVHPSDFMKNPHLYKFSEDRWKKVTIETMRGEVKNIVLTVNKFGYQNPHEFSPKPSQLEFSFTIYNKELLGKRDRVFKDYINGIVFTLNMCELNNLNQNQVITLFKQAFIDFEGDYGYINTIFTMDAPFAGDSFYENIVGDEEFYMNNNYCERVGGYFWGNILTDKHIKKLGGIKNFEKKSPFSLIEKMKNSNNNAYYFQLSENLYEIDKDKYLDLRKFLSPLLPKICAERIVLNIDPNDKKLEQSNIFFTDEENEKLSYLWMMRIEETNKKLAKIYK